MNFRKQISTWLTLGWMALVIVVFVIVTIPETSNVAAMLPEIFWRMRNIIYPIFYSRSLF